jgi:dehydrogenase/reductase SDR family member 4
MFRLDHNVAIITGASRGIGRAIALAYAKQGARLALCARPKEACDPVVDEIREAGGEAFAMAANVSDKAQLQALVDATLTAYGKITNVVSNAAANPAYGPMHAVDDSVFDKIILTNVKSNFWLANMTAPEMAKAGGGSFIVISSVSGLAGSKMIGVYATSKTADFQLARNLAVEWGAKNVRANCIAPGLIKTDFAKAIWDSPKALAFYNGITPIGRIGEPEDIAGLAVFLGTDEASFITGQTYVADGGLSVRDVL